MFTSYAERFGGFGSQRGLGVMFWLLANIVDCMIAGDTTGAEELFAALPRLRRWASGWVRLVLKTIAWTPPSPLDRYAGVSALTYVPPAFDFDSTLGFPGEGCWFFRVGLSAVALRQKFRLERPLPEGRPVERVTEQHRAKLWQAFQSWARDQGIPEELFEA